MFDDLTHEWELIKLFPKAHPDGQPARVDVMRMPAKFYRVSAMAGTDSVGEPKPEYALTTGSGEACRKWAHKTARLISDGMIGIA